MECTFQMAVGLEYANLFYANFPIMNTLTRQMEIRARKFCVHCVLDTYQSGYMCQNKTDPFQTKQKTQLQQKQEIKTLFIFLYPRS